jgi:hypothetical protein
LCDLRCSSRIRGNDCRPIGNGYRHLSGGGSGGRVSRNEEAGGTSDLAGQGSGSRGVTAGQGVDRLLDRGSVAGQQRRAQRRRQGVQISLCGRSLLGAGNQGNGGEGDQGGGEERAELHGGFPSENIRVRLCIRGGTPSCA